ARSRNTSRSNAPALNIWRSYTRCQVAPRYFNRASAPASKNSPWHTWSRTSWWLKRHRPSYDLPIMNHPKAMSVGQLKEMGYKPSSVKDELRRNLIAKLRKNEELFPGIIGYR